MYVLLWLPVFKIQFYKNYWKVTFTITLNSNYSKGTALLQCKLTTELFNNLIPMSDQEGIESPYNNNTINSEQTSDEKEENVN